MLMKKILLGIAALIVFGFLLDFAWKKSGLFCSKDMDAKIQIKSLSDRVKEFRRDCNRLPTNEEGLQALVSLNDPNSCPKYSKDSYIESGLIPVDPWDQEIKYETDGRTFKISIKHEGKIFVNEGQDVKVIEINK